MTNCFFRHSGQSVSWNFVGFSLRPGHLAAGDIAARVQAPVDRAEFRGLCRCAGLPFPRACLPIGYVLIELQQLVMSMVVLTVIVLATGEPLTWYWLLAIPALLLQAVFNVGMGDPKSTRLNS